MDPIPHHKYYKLRRTKSEGEMPSSVPFGMVVSSQQSKKNAKNIENH